MSEKREGVNGSLQTSEGPIGPSLDFWPVFNGSSGVLLRFTAIHKN